MDRGYPQNVVEAIRWTVVDIDSHFWLALFWQSLIVFCPLSPDSPYWTESFTEDLQEIRATRRRWGDPSSGAISREAGGKNARARGWRQGASRPTAGMHKLHKQRRGAGSSAAWAARTTAGSYPRLALCHSSAQAIRTGIAKYMMGGPQPHPLSPTKQNIGYPQPHQILLTK
jgi:hypothetical protein